MKVRSAKRLAVLLAAAAPLIASCSLDDQTIGAPAAPSGGSQFAHYTAIGTSLSAGFESGGINDSTQREGPAYQLALAMGLTPGVDWHYPAFNFPGCPAPFVNPLANNGAGTRVGGAPNPPTPGFCRARVTASAAAFMNDLAIPGLRAAQAIDLLNYAFPKTDTLGLAQFITGSVNPVNAMLAQHPTFVTVEVGANDVLGGATRGDTTLLTSVASFTATVGAIRDSINTLSPKPNVAIANVPNVTVIPYFTKASTLFCLNTGACGFPAALPYSSPLFTVDPSCAPNQGGGVGDNYLLTLPATAAITSVLAASRAAKIDCQRDSALVAVAAAPAPATAPAGATINVAEYPVITGRVTAFNAAIQAVATSEGWAYVDLNATLAGQAANIPALPNFANQLALFGCPSAGCPAGTATIFSQDGVHPNKNGYRIMAQAMAAAINTKYGSNLTVP